MCWRDCVSSHHNLLLGYIWMILCKGAWSCEFCFVSIFAVLFWFGYFYITLPSWCWSGFKGSTVTHSAFLKKKNFFFLIYRIISWGCLLYESVSLFDGTIFLSTWTIFFFLTALFTLFFMFSLPAPLRISYYLSQKNRSIAKKKKIERKRYEIKSCLFSAFFT